MKVYLALPLAFNRNRILAEETFKVVKDIGCIITSEWLVWDDPNPGLNTNEIYERDLNAIKSSDVLIAEISEPSIGIGMEIMLAHHYGKKIVCIYKNNKISNLLQALPGINIIHYSGIEDLSKKLRNVLLV